METRMDPVLTETLVAPCGINCGICKAHLRKKNPCHGCSDAEQNKPKTRVNCRLRLCRKRTGPFCFSCAEFPCDRLKHLDDRYRARYGMSEIENLAYIRDNGMEKFLETELGKWVQTTDSGTEILCVHDRKRYPVR